MKSVSVETMKAGGTVLLSVDQLAPHPDNPRRFYKREELETLAVSIREMGGVEQALIVILEKSDRYLVVDGHYRLAAAKTLKKPPLLKCEIRPGTSRREILLVMARTSTLWFAKDPISEAMHYRKLVDEEGVTRLELTRQLGHSQAYIAGRLHLLDIESEIQELIAEGKLSKDPRIVDALLQVDPGARVGLALELAKRGATLKASIEACERLRGRLAGADKDRRMQEARKGGKPNSIHIAEERLGDALPKNGSSSRLREAARQVCAACDIREQSLSTVAEPAWAQITHSAGEVCGSCPLAKIRQACSGCPLPEMLVRLVGPVRERAPVRGHVRS